MASRALSLLKPASLKHSFAFDRRLNSLLLVSTLHCFRRTGRSTHRLVRNCSSAIQGTSSLPPPDVPRLAETARISLTENEVEEFAPKIRQVIDWFGQLQAADLNSVEPAIRAGTEGENLREDIPETFHNREAMIGSVPSYEEPYIKVPKVLNKE